LKLNKLTRGQLIGHVGRRVGDRRAGCCGIYIGETIEITHDLLYSAKKASYKCFNCKQTHKVRYGRLKVYDVDQKIFVDFIAEI